MKNVLRKGFTLIELLVVVAVLALLASIVFSNLGGAREGARISNVLSFQSQTHTLLGSDLVGWWKLNENLNDISGVAGNASFEGGFGTPVYEDGVSGGKALRFSNDLSVLVNPFYGDSGVLKSSEYVTSANYDGDFTATVWAKPTLLDGTNRHVIIDNNSNEGYIAFRNDRIIAYWGSTVQVVTFLETINNNQWYNVTMVHEMSRGDSLYKLRLYVNGDYINQSTISIPSGNVNYGPDGYLRIGRYWRGLIDDVRIYERALTAQEISTLYAQTKDRYLANE